MRFRKCDNYKPTQVTHAKAGGSIFWVEALEKFIELTAFFKGSMTA